MRAAPDGAFRAWSAAADDDHGLFAFWRGLKDYGTFCILCGFRNERAQHGSTSSFSSKPKSSRLYRQLGVGPIDSLPEGSHDIQVKRLSILLLLIGVVVGLAIQQPVQAFAAPMGKMDMTAMAGSDMPTIPACLAKMQRNATHAPCKCSMAECIAMMAAGAPMMLADGLAMITFSAPSERDERIGTSLALRSRSTAPEPEPPTA